MTDEGRKNITVNADVITVNRERGRSSSSPLSSAASVRSLSSTSSTVRTHRSMFSTGASSLSPSQRAGRCDSDGDSVVCAMRRRALTPTRLAQSSNASTLSLGRGAAMFQALSSSQSVSPSLVHSLSNYSTGSRSLNHLQLSYSSYKAVRKALVRSEIGAFLEHDSNTHQGSLLRDQPNHHTGMMRDVIESMADFDENDYPATSPMQFPSPGFVSSTVQGSTTSHHQSASRKRELKKHHRLMQMTASLRESILQEVR
jgi:hypothetical protein